MQTAPYTSLAQIYDNLMDHVDYAMWGNYIKRLLKVSKLKVHTLADLSVGTGKHIPWQKSIAKRIVACDLSYEMLQIARKKGGGGRVLFFNADACFPAIKNESCDAVLMLYDSINYILEEEKITELFRQINQLLKEGGVFIFDCITPFGAEPFKDYYDTDTCDGHAYERSAFYDAEEQIQYNEFKLLINGVTYFEQHKQIIRSSAEWKTIIEKSPMHLYKNFSNFTLQPENSQSERIHFICKKSND